MRFIFVLLLSISAFFTPLYAETSLYIEPPSFSHASGFYSEEFELVLEHSDPKVTIYYTLDGSVPDPKNINGSTYQYKNEYAQPPQSPSGDFLEFDFQTQIYQKPIRIANRTEEPNRLAIISTTYDKYPEYLPGKVLDTWENKVAYYINKGIYQTNRVIKELNRALNKVDWFSNRFYLGLLSPRELKKEERAVYKGMVIRALAIDSEDKSSEIVSHTFFVSEPNQFRLPVISILVPEKALFDYNEGVFVAGKDYDDWLVELATGKEGVLATKQQANWDRKGDNIQAHLQVFNEHGQAIIGQKVDIRVHGGGSRALANKSIRIYPRAQDEEASFDYALFADSTPLKLSRIILRNAGQHNSHTYFADAAIQQAMLELNVGIQRYQPIVLFINGEYYGLLNARDRMDKYYLESTFGLPTSKVDFINNNEEIKEGSVEGWHQLLHFVENSPKDSELFFPELEKQIDVNSFIDYQATEIFIANTDWPHNNIRYWRYKGSKKYPITAQGFTDGRWRWLLFDLDHMGGGIAKYNVSHNTLNHATDPDAGWSTFMLRTLLKNPQFKQRFITRFSDLLNSTYQANHINKGIAEIKAMIEPEMPRHIERWSVPRSMTHWHLSIDQLSGFFEKRPAYQWQHLQRFFNLEDPYTVTVELKEVGSGSIVLNSLVIDAPWSGQYFKQLPLNLTAQPASGYKFSHWEVEGLSAEQRYNPELQLMPAKNLQIRVVMVKE